MLDAQSIFIKNNYLRGVQRTATLRYQVPGQRTKGRQSVFHDQGQAAGARDVGRDEQTPPATQKP
ncbi:MULTISPECIES: hypothetical protein [unclassified Pseudomonas]|uniref:hypothetical protein n=1 Tax=unclassified Pseudomonas TaxID=196821 RepID=UPI000FABEF9F|nr:MULTISPECIES: hypothetical protein [unclassified Pseudomonas]